MSKELEALHDLYLGINVHENMIVCERSLKALEIIIKKQVSVAWFLYTSSLEDFNGEIQYQHRLTQEEYDLLKEVLLYYEK